jgi:hypothetical protein
MRLKDILVIAGAGVGSFRQGLNIDKGVLRVFPANGCTGVTGNPMGPGGANPLVNSGGNNPSQIDDVTITSQIVFTAAGAGATLYAYEY